MTETGHLEDNPTGMPQRGLCPAAGQHRPKRALISTSMDRGSRAG